MPKFHHCITLKNFSLTLTVLFLASCNDMKLEENKPQDIVLAENQVQEVFVSHIEQFQENFVVKVEPDQEPYKYRVLMSWKKFSEPKTIRFKKGSNITETDQTVGYFSFSVAHNQKIIFDIDVLNANRKIEHSFQKEIEIPRDFVVTSENRILNNPLITKGVSYYNINRLYLSTSDVLAVSDAEAVLNVNELFASSLNESFIANSIYLNGEASKALKDTDGRHGGKLHVRIKNLYGKVHFLMSGESGGDGTSGLPWDSRAQDGRNGIEGICSIAFVPAWSIKNVTFRDPPERCYCIDSGSAPTVGQSGQKGRSGNNGKNGGDSGDIDVLVEKIIRNRPLNPDDLQLPEEFVKVSLIPGTKGKKGSGSPGQPGGIGGKNVSGKCTTKGPEQQGGATGPKGDDGLDGLDGNLGHKCVSIPSEGVNFCE